MRPRDGSSRGSTESDSRVSLPSDPIRVLCRRRLCPPSPSFRGRYEPAESLLFAAAEDAEARQRSRQRAAEDLLWTIEHFADRPESTGRSTYNALRTIFDQQCEVSGDIPPA